MEKVSGTSVESFFQRHVAAPAHMRRSSFLYLKISSERFGPQMPPTGALPSDQIEIIRRWIDEGAEWPDALAGSDAPPVPTPPLMTAVPLAL